jgi:hypothetical protein
VSNGPITSLTLSSIPGGSPLWPTVDNFRLAQGLASPVPGPMVGAGIPGLVMAFGGFLAWRRRKGPALTA